MKRLDFDVDWRHVQGQRLFEITQLVVVEVRIEKANRHILLQANQIASANLFQELLICVVDELGCVPFLKLEVPAFDVVLQD